MAPQDEGSQTFAVSVIVANAIAFGILIVDHISLFPRECAIYSGKKTKSFPIAFVVLRYSGLIALIPSLLLAALKTNHCQALIISHQIGGILVIASSGLVLLITAAQRWDGNIFVYGILGLTFGAMCACSCVAAVQFKPAPILDNASPSTCQLLPLSALATLGYGASLMFDLVVLMLLIFKPRYQIHSLHLPTDHTTLICVGATFLANLVSFIPHAMNGRLDHVKLSFEPFTTVVIIIAGVRIFLQNNGTDQRRRPSGLPTTSRPVSTDILKITRQPTIMVTPPQGQEGTPMKSYTVMDPGMTRSDTPFSSYDYESDEDDKKPSGLEDINITREIVVTFE